MIAYKPAEAEGLIAAVRKRYASSGVAWIGEALDMADQLDAARAEIERLEAECEALDRAMEQPRQIAAALAEQLREVGSEADQLRARVAELEVGWRGGIEASIRRLEAQGRKPHDLWHPAYFAAIDEALVHLRAMLARGTERGDTTVDV